MRFQHIFKQIDTGKSVFYAWSEAMHTRIDVVLCELSEETSLALTNRILDEINRIEKFADRFNPASELSKINKLAALEPLTISAEMLDILQDCIRYNQLSLGAFDITIQSLNNYRHGISDIVIDQPTSTIHFKNKNVQLDLCGFIKGYALDKAMKILTEEKCSNALLNFGNSSVCAMGNHPNGKGWKVKLPEQQEEFVTLYNECLTNSGNSSNHLHIIEPSTGDFSKTEKIVSVVTNNATVGEVLATALCACNPTNAEHIRMNILTQKTHLQNNQ